MAAETSYGALLIGAFLAFGLSGAIALQCVVYFKMYPRDRLKVKILASTAWFLDILHSVFICVSLITYFITFFGQPEKIDFIPWTIAFTVVVTAIQTFLVHCFFARKILKASGRNWLITGPIVLLALGRLFAASVSTFEMVRLHQFSAFIKKYPGWVFTTGLALSSGVDIIIMGWLCYYLRTMRRRIAPGSTIMIRLVDSVTIYTLENGALTCFATTASLICWLTMPKNLIFFGLHFVIGKLYANSLLASLNVRRELREIRWNMENRICYPSRQQSSFVDSRTYQNSFSSGLQTGAKPQPLKVLGATDFDTTRHGSVVLHQFRPREPTIQEF